MIKKVSLLIVILPFAIISFAQNKEVKSNKGKFGTSIASFGSNDAVSKESLDGAAGYNGDGFYRLGFNYIYSPKCDCIGFETGLEYARHKIIVTPNLPPDMDNSPYERSLSLLSIPILFRANLLKYIFFNGGLSFDFDASVSSPIESQTGIGGSLGLGIEYDFKFGMSLFTNVYSKSHSLISFAPKDNRHRLLESGIRFGILYRL